MALRLILDAGIRNQRGKERDCRLLYQVDSRGRVSVSLQRDPNPADVPIIVIPYQQFRAMMSEHGLGFRQYLTNEQRQQNKQESLDRYRSSPKYKRTRKDSASSMQLT